VKVILQYLQREAAWPLLVAVVAAVILLPGLDRAGFWEPYEIRVADRAHERLESEDADEPAHADRAAETNEADKDEADEDESAADSGSSEPPFLSWSMAQGMRLVGGDKELGARLPLALLGLVTVLATFFLGRRLASPRAGLISALVLLSFPLLLFQSRQLMSDIGTAAGSTLAVLGLVGLAWPAGARDGARDGAGGKDGRAGRPAWLWAVDAALVIAGAAISYYSAAALRGLVVPFGAVGLACAAGLAATAEPAADAPAARRGSLIAGLALLALGVSALAASQALALERTAQLVLGVVPIVLGVLLLGRGAISGRLFAGERAQRRQRVRLAGVAALGLGVAVVALVWVLAAVFDLRDPIPGERALLGYSVVSSNDYVAPLGGVWLQGDVASSTFDTLFERIAYGLFPWSALAPVALVHLAMGLRRGRATWAGFVPLAWAVVAWVVATVMARKVGPTHYPALTAVALGIGTWLDHVLAAREQAAAAPATDTAGEDDVALRLPLVALFVLLGALVVGKDLLAFPDRLSGLSALEPIEYPKETTLLGLDLKVYWMVFGNLLGMALAGGLWLWEREPAPALAPERSPGRSPGKSSGRSSARASTRPDERSSEPEPERPLDRARRWARALGREGVRASVVIGLGFALFLVQGWLPAMSHKLSSKELYAAYNDAREDDEPLGVLGNPGSGLTYYAGSGYETLRSREQLVEFLRRPTRVFALAPAAELCALHRTIRGQVPYHVLDNSHAKFLLFSNQLRSGESDRNPLAQAIVREPPASIQRPLRVDFDGRVELIGVDMPAEVERGDTFEMTLYFRVVRPVTAAWKLFLHFDGGGMRFQGDHDPIEGRCATTFWQPGDYIVDKVEVEAGNLTYAKTEYTVYAGFFRGSHGSWNNMTIKSAADGSGRSLSVDQNNRVNIGTVQVR
jgi:4-amino-4-deoxy-L-arabinose transferase-like glycosyltransferase